MKKISVLIFGLIIILSLISCQDTATDDFDDFLDPIENLDDIIFSDSEADNDYFISDDYSKKTFTEVPQDEFEIITSEIIPSEIVSEKDSDSDYETNYNADYKSEHETFSQNITDTVETYETPTYVSNSSNTVWKSKSGSKYHSKPSCSNMKSPTEITKSEAIASGLTACKKCH